MVVIQVHPELLLWVAEDQVDLKAVLVWARPISSAGKTSNEWEAVVMGSSGCCRVYCQRMSQVRQPAIPVQAGLWTADGLNCITTS